MPLQNYVIFQRDVPERLHFVDHAVEQIVITDSRTGRQAPRNRLSMTVDEINGSKTDAHGLPIIAKLSVLAEGLAGKLEAYLPGKTYLNYDFIITQSGSGDLTRYSVQVIPRAK